MNNRMHAARAWLSLCACAVLGWTASGAHAADAHAKDRDALWKQVHDMCAVKAGQGVYPPAPCIDVQPGQNGYAIFKDRDGRYQYLLLPLARITGIESPLLLTPDAANYLARAWSARLYVEAALDAEQSRDVIGLVVNSPMGRSQDQLHIHIDCLRADVRDTIKRLLPAITEHWNWLPEALPPNQHRYLARWVSGADLKINPFKDLAHALPPGDSMAMHSLVVIGAYSPSGKPGFVLLSGRVDVANLDRGNADDLQDMGCAIARRVTSL
ncbi:CDP-diacylglycerol diphosphatase [Dyella flava]|uniref:CDP-diacylglycerol pyrophosphatase n=1 Tax=Dyella flava TaxID=1920170 RepID=A0ABS2JZJ3_9GAMM|nr:CDP-diacylglycerol diphosphatase [Dyella flava]MBM7124054.1 CDP-diacylglycerol diphosphatase [Dyella flava]GLQ52378.1 CDP-diacylglycerol diphosphatase [Dyella flava]